MKIILDTNVLIRVVMKDDLEQSIKAEQILKQAKLIAIPLVSLCEFVWVLKKVYKLDSFKIAQAIETILEISNVQLDRISTEKGLSFLNFGGDFADGAIAYSGQHLGGEFFVTFDQEAKKIANKLNLKHIILE